MVMNICPEGFIEIVEGLAKICSPDLKLYTRANGVFEPAIAPVFYNPNMVENRDIAIEVVDYIIKTLPQPRELVVVDPLAATGVRGIRISLEVSKPELIKVFMSDISDEAVKIMKFNISLNNLWNKVIVEKSDANELLYRLRRLGIRIDYIDIDPFGSPAPFSYAAIANIKNGGVAAFTATDLAVLEGKYVDKLFRRYGVVGSITPISKDIAIRVLLSYIARVAYAFNKYIEPILSYIYKHYVRIYVKVFDGATKASNQLKTCLKKIIVCPNCSYNNSVDLQKEIKECPLCSSHIIEIKPLWVCRTVSKEVIEILAKNSELKPWIQKTTKQLLRILHEYSYIDTVTIRLSFLARILRINTPPRDKVIDCLVNLGHRAMKSYTYHDGIESTASIEDIVKCMKS
jgi:tRNA (guanine26-N2/guanine27-N2)-dimethyltransferase